MSGLDHKRLARLAEEQAYIEVVTMMIHADKVIEVGELVDLQNKLNSQFSLSRLSEEELTHLLHRAVADLDQEGADARIAAIAKVLTAPEQRTEAIRMALEICSADGKITASERAVLEKMRRAFELSEAAVAAILEP
ncbi:MAG: tellurite resistance TerB family protein [Anaerolineae bacterium]|nr:tellurite resistance TerB family protein [Anaerolineae bacterium]